MLSNAACNTQTHSPFDANQLNSHLLTCKYLPIEAIVTVGRFTDAFIKVDASVRTVSRVHALLYTDSAGRVFIADNGSRNGTYVNGERLPGIQRNGRPAWRLVRNDDRVSLGSARCYLDFVHCDSSANWVRIYAL